jgi:alpha/beta superfamily hydrolase
MLDGPAGRLEALLEEPEDREPRFAALVCHPHPQHGGTMHTKAVYRTAKGLRKAGAAVLRFNYRGVNLSHGEYAHGIGETEDARAALAFLRSRYPRLPFALAGFSFGARVIHRLGCPMTDALFLMPVGFPTRYGDMAQFSRCPVRRIFILSTNDEFAPRETFQAWYDTLDEPKKLIWIESPDHYFKDALPQLEEAAAAAVPAF